MKRSFTAAVLTAIIAVLSPSLFAQWPLHPKPGVPKGPDGKPNLKRTGAANGRWQAGLVRHLDSI